MGYGDIRKVNDSNSGCEIKKSGYVIQEVDGLYQEVDLLNDEVLSLFDKFRQVLRVEPACEKDKNVKMEVLSVPLADTLYQLKIKLISIRENIKNLKQLTEI